MDQEHSILKQILDQETCNSSLLAEQINLMREQNQLLFSLQRDIHTILNKGDTAFQMAKGVLTISKLLPSQKNSPKE